MATIMQQQPQQQPAQDPAALSLLTLSLAAAARSPEPRTHSSLPSTSLPSHHGINSLGLGLGLTHSSHPTPPKIRRLSSTGAHGRRLSDARDAATRPTLLSAASSYVVPPSVSSITVPMSIPHSRSEGANDSALSSTPGDENGSLTKNGAKKRGQIYTCESCAKQYKHPNCLIKHRWEHSPHWREASKYVLSKHQQVQLLEAAAILSHLSTSPSGTSLPDDRSYWPSFLSPELPTPSPSNVGLSPGTSSSAHRALSGPGSSGPRMHDYALPAHVSELRPGLLGVPTPPKGTTPAPSSSFTRGHSKSARSFSGSGTLSSPGLSDPWMSSPSTSLSSAFTRSFAGLDVDPGVDIHAGGQGSSWTLPSSDLRSSARGEEEKGFEAVKEEDEDDAMSLGRREDGEDDEWAGDMDMD